MKLAQIISAFLVILTITLSVGCSTMSSDGTTGSTTSDHGGY